MKGVIILASAITVLGAARLFTTTKPPEVAAKKTTERPQSSPVGHTSVATTLEQPASAPVFSNSVEERNPRAIGAISATNSLKAPVEFAEPAYICGAATKKGAPCSRKVKGNVRCWQHAGQPAMLPPDQLRVTR